MRGHFAENFGSAIALRCPAIVDAIVPLWFSYQF